MDSAGCSRAIGGWLAGCGAATGILCAFALVISAVASGDIFSFRFAGNAVALLFPAALIFIITCLLTGIPAAIVIWLSEKFGIRSILFFGCIGAAIGVLSQSLIFWPSTPLPQAVSWLFLMAGSAAGLAYWHVAGKYAGRDRHRPSGPA
jgi:hypothetical protein